MVLSTHQRPRVALQVCPVQDCTNLVTVKYDGRPGVALSRYTHDLQICSDCGVKEAFGRKPLAMRSMVQP